MLTPSEKRFIRTWEEQRTGGRWSYYASYTFVVSFILLMLTYITIFWVLGESAPRPLWIVPVLSVIGGFLVTMYAWRSSEKKFKSIIKREIKAGTKLDIESGDALVEKSGL